MAGLRPGWMGGGSTHGWELVLGARRMQGLGEARVWSSPLCAASEEQRGQLVERGVLSGTVAPEVGRALAAPGLSSPHPFSPLILLPSLSLCLPAARRSSKYLAWLFFVLLLFTCYSNGLERTGKPLPWMQEKTSSLWEVLHRALINFKVYNHAGLLSPGAEEPGKVFRWVGWGEEGCFPFCVLR